MNFTVLPKSAKNLIAKFKGRGPVWRGNLLGVANVQHVEGQVEHFEDHVAFKYT